jgi:hypothetical protein
LGMSTPHQCLGQGALSTPTPLNLITSKRDAGNSLADLNSWPLIDK